MTINQAIIAALKGFGDPVVPDLYTGTRSRYYTFNYALVPHQFADNKPLAYRALIQVHFVCPMDYDSVSRQMETMAALAAAGFSWPEMVRSGEKDPQHIIFDCEYITKRPE